MASEASNAPFLEKLAEHIAQRYITITRQLCIVVPNRRAKLFLKNYLAKHIKKAIWAPEIYAIEDFIVKLADVQVLDNTSLLFTFYDVYKRNAGEDAQPFEEFSKWAGTLLNDFNDMDSYLADTGSLFSYISESRALEVWNPGASQPTDLQKNYLAFWRSLGEYYELFTHHLREKKQAYPGLAYRMVAENLPDKIKNQSWGKIIFAGFNALSAAEEKIIETLVKSGKAEALWDADIYYLDNPAQEAGRFLRKYKSRWYSNNEREFRWTGNFLGSEKKEITIIGVAGNVGQAKAAGELLRQINDETDYSSTALVLADENLLVPVLHAVPEQVKELNITMGFPLRNVSLYNLFNNLLLLHQDYRSERGEILFYHRHLLKIFRHGSLQQSAARDTLNSIISYIKSHNRVFIGEAEIMGMLEKNEDSAALKILFENWRNDPEKALRAFLSLIDFLKKPLKDSGHSKSMEMEYLFYFARIVKQLSNLLKEHNSINGLKALQMVFAQLVQSETLPFYGEPLKGLQVMGMLETRTLDFETVILLSANEGMLPAAKSQNSFIPYEIKREFNLPSHSEKDAIFAYHFYRLLQRAKNVFLLYNTETDEFGSGEKSRFITQLTEELPKVNPHIVIRERFFTLPVQPAGAKETIINKTPEIIQRIEALAAEGFSPSALNTFIRCPLDFYYRYILKLREEDDIEENVEAGSFGTFIHQALEALYADVKGRALTVGDIEKMKGEAEKVIRKKFLEEFSEAEISRGKNLLALKVAVKLVHGFLNAETQRLKENGSFPLTIEALETKLEAELKLHIYGDAKTVKIKGTVDRIEKDENITRVIDYKTGHVDPKHLKVEIISDVSMPEKAKSLQLLTYAWLYRKMHPKKNGQLQSAIISLRKLSEGVMAFSNSESKILTADFLISFEEELKKIITGLFDLEIPFKHSHESEFCDYCGS